jgi:hypothetical protein
MSNPAAIPRSGVRPGFFKLEQERCGMAVAKPPACYGFSVVAKVKPGHEQAIRDYGKTIEKTVEANPRLLEPLKLHYLRWILFDVGSGLHFMYQGIFDTDLDKYLEDAIALFIKTGVAAVFVHLEGWPDDWRTNTAAVIAFFRDHECPSFLEYGEFPSVTAEEIERALALDTAVSRMLDQVQ